MCRCRAPSGCLHRSAFEQNTSKWVSRQCCENSWYCDVLFPCVVPRTQCVVVTSHTLVAQCAPSCYFQYLFSFLLQVWWGAAETQFLFSFWFVIDPANVRWPPPACTEPLDADTCTCRPSAGFCTTHLIPTFKCNLLSVVSLVLNVKWTRSLSVVLLLASFSRHQSSFGLAELSTLKTSACTWRGLTLICVVRLLWT